MNVAVQEIASSPETILWIFIMSLKVPKSNSLQIFKDGYKVRISNHSEIDIDCS